MATYTSTADGNSYPSNLAVSERHLYGSSRLGIFAQSKDVKTTPSFTIGTLYKTSFTRGYKYYELTNHLGNVLATISDKKVGHNPGSGIIDYYTADVVSANDYYPGGMDMPGRSYYTSPNANYRYGFNGKEKDKESPVQYDYGFRIYDPRLVRFKSVDSLAKKYPELTPYQFASNSPISGIDLDGLEYLSSNVARIEVSRGYVYLKMNNVHNITKNTYDANKISDNWSYGPDGKKGIGISLKIGSVDYGLFTPKLNSEIFSTDNTIGAPDPNYQPGQIEIEKGKAKSTGQTYRRLKDREITSLRSPAAGRGLAIASVAIDALIVGGSLLQEYQVNEDISLAHKHEEFLKMAYYDVNQGLLKGGVIPKEYQTEERLSDITNVVLSGVSNLNDKKILEIGKNIYDQFSKQRQKYDGTTKVTGPSGVEIINKPKPNPTYNPNYGK